MRKLMSMVLSLFASGCAAETSQPVDEDQTGAAASAVEAMNQLAVNGIYPNGIYPNGIYPNGLSGVALTVNTINPVELSALQDPGPAGDLSRSFLKYTVSCAFDSGQSITLTWNEGANQETYAGDLGLAPEWETEALSPAKQRWLSACLAARVNYYAATVLISMRGNENDRLGATLPERLLYNHQEGAFYGNVFSAAPKMYSCYHNGNRAYSRSKSRDCAAGHVDGNGINWCGIIDSTGDCSSVCTDAADPELGYSSCDTPGAGPIPEVITVFLD